MRNNPKNVFGFITCSKPMCILRLFKRVIVVNFASHTRTGATKRVTSVFKQNNLFGQC
jgi:hypothetical protein